MSAELFNVSHYLLDRRVEAGDGQRVALTGPAGDLSYAQLLDAVRRTASVLVDLGLRPEQRLLMVVADSPQFVQLYLAAMRIGAIPVPVSTMLRSPDIAELVSDSRAPIVVSSPEFAEAVLLAAGNAAIAVSTVDDLVKAAMPSGEIYPTTADSPAFWLYTSGTTGTPKGAMHRHGNVRVVCETYASQVLGITPADRTLSAAKA